MLLALDPAPQQAPLCAAGNALADLYEALASPCHPATLTAAEGLREPHAPAELPTSDPETEAVEMCQWLKNNAKRCKTHSGILTLSLLLPWH